LIIQWKIVIMCNQVNYAAGTGAGGALDVKSGKAAVNPAGAGSAPANPMILRGFACAFFVAKPQKGSENMLRPWENENIRMTGAKKFSP
jgi:hypothetical protein